MGAILSRFDHIAALGPEAYGLLALVLFAEAIGIPSPDEATLFVAGIAVARGDLNWFAVVGSSAAGALAGALVSYTLATRVGRPLIVRYGRRVGLSDQRLDSLEGFMRRGALAAFLGRIVSGVRLVIGYASGLFGMRRSVFVVASAAGALVWSAADVTAGMLIGHRIAAVGRFARAHLVWALAAGVLIVAAWWLWHRRGHPRPPGRT